MNELVSFFLRKRGDSNPRYGYPYVSLANWWFQPLTHTSPGCSEISDCKDNERFLINKTFFSEKSKNICLYLRVDEPEKYIYE